MARLTPEYRKQIRALIDEGSLDLDSGRALQDTLDTIDALEAEIASRDRALEEAAQKLEGEVVEHRGQIVKEFARDSVMRIRALKKRKA